ncbi:MAG: AAA-like domain protein [Syntrophorhabdaceae bacterium PtaU1.Bin034]|nr:MAG: AAA-like domain protein [Syntrophorhabdaceae bacterium PtaU1.Bin034]
MGKPVEQIAALTIGTVESVSPAEIRVLLEPNAPQTTALNTGVPTGFPRINGYVLIPNETGAVVGLVVWLGVERLPFPKRTGLKDFGLVDLPFPARKISLTPLGTLLAAKRSGDSERAYRLERGVSAFPSVGDVVQLPTAEQLRCIVEASDQEDRRVKIGTSPLAANASVTVDPDKIFGRHLAVLGNTGSGKSCSVAGLLRWSMQEAQKARADSNRPNARVIILDPNGEYSNAFQDYKNVRRFQVSPKAEGIQPLLLPAWMWNSHEWSAFSHAAPNVQRPLLLRALGDLRAGQAIEVPITVQIRRDMTAYEYQIDNFIQQAPQSNSNYVILMGGIGLLQNIQRDAAYHASRAPESISGNLSTLEAKCRETLKSLSYRKSDGSTGYRAFSVAQLTEVRSDVSTILSAVGGTSADSLISEDAPVPFPINTLPDHLEKIASDAPGTQTSQFVATLTMRIRMMLADRRLGLVVNPDQPILFQQWLETYVGKDKSEGGEIAIIDLSLVSSDVLHMVIAVVARIVFEATQRYRKLNDSELPTVLVLEEAHTFVRKGSDEESDTPTPAQMCRQTFERIAREGRKFGLGLVLSSQRPSELSQTVLAQCNTFLLHRIVNDKDQELVGKLVPDNLGGLLKELPSLPSRQAILLGWATAVPTLVEITELPESQRPRSSDPKFWDVWTGKEERTVDWGGVVEDWTGISVKPMRKARGTRNENQSDENKN